MTIKFRFAAPLALALGLAASSLAVSPAAREGIGRRHAAPAGVVVRRHHSASTTRTSSGAASRCSRPSASPATPSTRWRSATSPSRAGRNCRWTRCSSSPPSWPIQVKDINDKGEPIERAPRSPTASPRSIPNEAAARVIHNGALPPDLSVIAKARTFQRGFPWWVTDIFTQYNENGVDYIVALLNGYEDAPAGFKVPDGSFYNKYFPGHIIGMTPPIADGLVTYGDGTPETQLQYSKDVATFLMWAAEPTLDARKRIGWYVLGFLVIFAGLLYATKMAVWRQVKGHA